MGKIVLAIMIASLASCNFFFQTQVSFENSTSSYTFLAIKIGSVDDETPLTPNQQTSFTPIGQGSYYLYTKGIDGIWYQWPAQQSIAAGYSYTIIFSADSTTGNLTYSTYIALEQ